MIKRLNGWQRIGIVLSIIWCIGSGVYLWIDQMNDLHESYGAQLHLCMDLPNGYEMGCIKDADAVFSNMVAALYRAWPWEALIFCSVTLAIGWFGAWGILATKRWIARGFSLE